MLCLAARELLVIGPVLCLARDCLVDFGLPWGRRDAGGGGLTHPEVKSHPLKTIMVKSESNHTAIKQFYLA